MRWRRLGMVFRPQGQSDWMASHAAVPVAKHLEGDRFRVYFSCRDRGGRSHVGWVLLGLDDPRKVRALSSSPVLRPGRLGAFDDSGAMLSWITPAEGQDYWYYIGWNLGVTVPFRNALGLAIGDERGGRRLFEGPILDRSREEPYFVASACVRRERQSSWRMWYLCCVGWELANGLPRHRYHIRHAWSTDGITWARDGTVCIDFLDADEYAISRPCVLKDGQVYKMWYSYRGESYRIGYAESLDGLSWQRHDDRAGIDLAASGWDSEMIEYPFVFDHDGSRYLLYNGNGYGRTGFGLAVLEDD